MSDPKHRWFDEVKYSLEVLKTMRNEVRLLMQLQSIDDEPRFAELELRLGIHQASVQAELEQMIEEFRLLRDELASACEHRDQA